MKVSEHTQRARERHHQALAALAASRKLRWSRRAERKINKAIDAMIDLQDNGFGCADVSRVLELLNGLRGSIAANLKTRTRD